MQMPEGKQSEAEDAHKEETPDPLQGVVGGGVEGKLSRRGVREGTFGSRALPETTWR